MIDDSTVSPETFEWIRSDPFVDWLGIELVELESGYAEMTLALEERHMNFHETPHGGVIYSLADSAFGAAGNASGETCVALETNISYLSAVEEGTTLRAVAECTHRSNKTEEYRTDVRTTEDKRVATFRGRTYKP